MPNIAPRPGQEARKNLIFICAIAAAGAALYLPFLNNELVFDDLSFFYQPNVLSHYATRPFDFRPRTFPYFTFAFVHALTQSFEVQRLVNLLIHLANGSLLFVIARQLFILTDTNKNVASNAHRKLHDREILVCHYVALAFVLHPVAVYGTAYLVQRTILFATFFSLLSLYCFAISLTTDNWRPRVLAALLASVAILSKEHAVTLPFAIAALTVTTNAGRSRTALIKTVIFILLCIPAMALVTFNARYYVANTYEIHVALFSPLTDESRWLWLRSALMECSLFFDYLRLWLAPDNSKMSVDIRPPFPLAWHEFGALAGGISFVSAVFIGFWLLLRSPGNRIAGFGLIYALILFSVELTTVRLQEPFVLYRSYLWAPGFLLCGAALLRNIQKGFIAAIFLTTLPYLAVLSVDRLESLKNNKAVWADAAEKLASDKRPGAFRIYYNRGVQYVKSRRYDLAMADMQRCESLQPDFFGCRLGKALIFEKRKEYRAALFETEAAIALDKRNPAAWEQKGRLLDSLGMPGSQDAYAEADRLGGSLGSLFRKKPGIATAN